jgi:hypothetical protein
MPKEPKKKMSATASSGSSSGLGNNNNNNNNVGRSSRHAPLGQVIQDDVNRGKYATRKKVGTMTTKGSRRGGDEEYDDDDDEVGRGDALLDKRSSRRILDMGREQRLEMDALEEEEGGMRMRTEINMDRRRKTTRRDKISRMGGGRGRVGGDADSDSDEELEDDDDEDDDDDDDEIMVKRDDSGYVTMASNAIGLTPEEEALLSNMMGDGDGEDDDDDGMPAAARTRNLADIIMAKIEEKEAMAARRGRGGMEGGGGGGGMGHDDNDDDEGKEGDGGMGMMELPPKVVQVSDDGGGGS